MVFDFLEILFFMLGLSTFFIFSKYKLFSLIFSEIILNPSMHSPL